MCGRNVARSIWWEVLCLRVACSPSSLGPLKSGTALATHHAVSKRTAKKGREDDVTHLDGARGFEDAVEVHSQALLVLVDRNSPDERDECRKDQLHRIDVFKLVDHRRQN